MESSLAAPLDYGVICDVQIHYHLIHDQIIQYLKKAGSEDSAFIKKLLWISWHMISEAEQMLFLINNRKTRTVNSARWKIIWLYRLYFKAKSRKCFI